MLRCRKCKQQIKRRSEACIYYRKMHRSPHYVMLMHNACVDEEERRFVVDTRDSDRLMKAFWHEIIGYAAIITIIAALTYWMSDINAEWLFISTAVFIVIVSTRLLLNLRTLNAMRRLPR